MRSWRCRRQQAWRTIAIRSIPCPTPTYMVVAGSRGKIFELYLPDQIGLPLQMEVSVDLTGQFSGAIVHKCP